MSDFLTAARERVVIYDGAIGTGIQAAGLTADDFGGPDLEGCNELLVVTRPDVIAGPARRLPRGRAATSSRPTRFGSLAAHRSPSTASPSGPTSSTWPPPASPRRWPSSLRHPRPPPLRRRLHRPGHQVPVARPDPLRRAARRVRGPGPRPARGRRRPAHHRDPLRPALGEGRHERRPPGHALDRPRGPAPGAGHHGAHRAHAARHRDRRRARRHRPHEARRHRHQLRHRPGRDGRAPPPPRRPRPHADLVHPQRRAAERRRRQDALRPHARAARRAPGPLRQRARRQRHRRLLRHHPGPPGRGGRALPRPRGRPPPPACTSPAPPRSTRWCRSSRTPRS